MSRQLFIRFPLQPAKQIQWLLYDKQSVEQGYIEPDQLYTLAATSQQYPTIVLLPGQQVLECRTELEGNSRLALKALPFQLEEQLSSPIEELHLVYSNIKIGQVRVNLIKHSLMETWLAQLSEAGLEVRACYADRQLLPGNRLCAWTEADQVLIQGPDSGVTLPLSLLPAWWQKYSAEQLSKSDSELCTTGDVRLTLHTDNPEIVDKLSGEIQLQPPVDDLLLLMATYYKTENCLNLCQGTYRQRDRLLSQLTPLRWPLLLLLMISLLWSLSLHTDNRYKQQKLSQYKVAIKEQFRQSFPHARNLVRPRAQMQHQLQQLETRYQQSYLLQGIYELNPLLADAAIKTTRLSYSNHDRALQLQLETASSAGYSRLKDSLVIQPIAIQLTEPDQRGATVHFKLNYSLASMHQENRP
ncbi:MAG: type II secretion system protein GspL [Marinobacterium sp.]|nr:type II secretion system protein GspL [Marinobacterium sp.]